MEVNKPEKEDFFEKSYKWIGIFKGVCFILATISLAGLLIAIVVGVPFLLSNYLTEYRNEVNMDAIRNFFK